MCIQTGHRTLQTARFLGRLPGTVPDLAVLQDIFENFVGKDTRWRGN